MKKAIALPLLSVLCAALSGCALGDRGGAVSILYGIAAVLAVLLLIGYLLLIKEKEKWAVLLFGSVAVVNSGYFLLSVSATLGQALMANRLSYLGSVFLPAAMLMIILKACGYAPKRWLTVLLPVIGAGVFLIAASPGILPIYYKEVTLVTVHGASALEKVYGPLHVVYLFYLLGYFSAMTAAIIHSAVKKRLRSVGHAVMLLSAVFINILVWLLGQFIELGFEPLALSYIISELFLVGLYLMLQEPADGQPDPQQVDAAMREAFMARLQALTKTERAVFDLYLEGCSSAEVRERMGIKENTLKYHNKNIYGKMAVSGRRELLELAEKYL